MGMYPVFLRLEGKGILVAGFGRVGRRKVDSLLEAGAPDIRVFDPGLEAGFLSAQPDAEETGHGSCSSSRPGPRTNAHFCSGGHGSSGGHGKNSGPDSASGDCPGRAADSPGKGRLAGSVAFFRRSLRETDLHGAHLVFACTADPAENARIAALCRARERWCNVADSPKQSSFHVPATARVGELCAAFSTGGHSPALARRIRMEAESWLADSYGPLLTFMARLRPMVLSLGDSPDRNAAMFRAVVFSGLGEALAAGDRAGAARVAASALPEPLHSRLEELLDGLV